MAVRQKIVLTPDDVHRVMGFPTGSEVIADDALRRLQAAGPVEVRRVFGLPDDVEVTDLQVYATYGPAELHVVFSGADLPQDWTLPGAES